MINKNIGVLKNTQKFKDTAISTYVYALGGLEEVGKNCYCIEYNDEVIVIDAGMKIDNSMLGSNNIIIPNFQYLNSPHIKHRTLLITHGHEDHIGAIKHLLKNVFFNNIYAPRLAIKLMQYKFEQSDPMQKEHIFRPVENGSEIKTVYSKCRYFAQNHSIPDAFGINIQTPNGNVVTTGDFKFDFSPLDHACDIQYMAEMGAKGVDLLLSDSTNAMVPGATKSESIILEDIETIFLKTKHRLILSTFASNVYRISKVLEFAKKYNRKVCLLGRSMKKIVECALSSNYLSFPKSMFVYPNQIDKIPHHEMLVLCTGSQGEPMAALSLMASQKHRFIKIVPTDTIVFSSNPIPGNFLSVELITNSLIKLGAHVLQNSALNLLHTSGHASIDEHKLMFHLTKPKYFMPMHGTYEMLKSHKATALKVGMKSEDVFLMANGDCLELVNGVCKISDRVVPTDVVFIDHDNEINLHKAVVKEREILAYNGIFTIIVHLKNNELVGKPRIITSGLVFVKDNAKFIYDTTNLVTNHLNKQLKNARCNTNDLKISVKNLVQPYIFKKTSARPIILPLFMFTKN